MIKIDQLTKVFNGKAVFEGISFTINPGEVYVIIGPSGTGKSTLLRCLNLLERPESGQLTLNDKTIDLANPRKEEVQYIREHISMVFQTFNLFKNKTAAQNITEPLTTVKKVSKDQARQTAESLLDQVGLSHRYDAYPITLSGGEQQRVGIARAMAMESDMILFDEPTSALDPGLVQEVLQVIQKLAYANTTMLIVTHEMQFARKIADQIIFMDSGEIVEIGPPEVIFNQPQNPRTAQFLKRMNE